MRKLNFNANIIASNIITKTLLGINAEYEELKTLTSAETDLLTTKDKVLMFNSPIQAHNISSYANLTTEYKNNSDVNIVEYGTTEYNQYYDGPPEDAPKYKVVVLPDTVTKLGYLSFMGYDSLTHVYIPETVTDIKRDGGSIPLKYLYRLKHIAVNHLNPTYKSIDGALYKRTYIQGSEMLVLLKYPVGKQDLEFSLPENTQSIQDYAFDGAPLTKIIIPKTVTMFELSAFKNCSNLSTLEYLGTVAEWQASFEQYVFPFRQQVTVVCTNGSINIQGTQPEESTSELTFTLKKDSDGTEYYLVAANQSQASSKTEIEIPEVHNNIPVTHIAASGFKNLSRLQRITIGANVTAIGPFAFDGCNSLEEFKFDTYNEVYTATNNGKLLCKKLGDNHLQIVKCANAAEEIEISASIISIGNKAFYECTRITEVEIPASVTSIECGAFYGCNSLTRLNLANLTSFVSSGEHHIGYIFGAETYEDNNVYLPASLTTIEIAGEATLKDGTFAGCKTIKKILYGSATDNTIGRNAFSGCINLSNVSVPDSLVNIDYAAFENCSSITAITIPNNVTKIGINAFKGCSNLEVVTIGDGVTLIDQAAFDNCVKLRLLNGAKNIQSIDRWAFYDCVNLREIVFYEQLRDIGIGAFTGAGLTKAIFMDTEGWYEYCYTGDSTTPYETEANFSSTDIERNALRLCSIKNENCWWSKVLI